MMTSESSIRDGRVRAKVGASVVAAVLLTALLIAGCTPLTVSFTLGKVDRDLAEAVVLQEPAASTAKVALVEVSGLIIDGARPGLLSEGANPIDETVMRLDRAAADPAVKAVVLRVNSPGGSVTGSDVLYREIERFRAQSGKPVVVSMGEIAASGGYYIALAGDEIVANPTTLTGSIGVIVPTVNVSQGLNRIGIVARSVKSGRNKDLANPLEPLREEQYAVLQGIVDEFYARFRGLVEERRVNVDRARLDELTDGRILTGAAARDAGLIDELGGVREALARAEARAGIKGARLIAYVPKDGAAPRTPYGLEASNVPVRSAPWPGAGGGSGGTEINLLQLNTGGVGTGIGGMGAGVYYLWLPGEL